MRFRLHFFAFFLLASFSVAAVHAASITISGGETITIESNKRTTVSCDAPTAAANKDKEDATGLCHRFHGDSECNSAPIGSPCSRGSKKGTCVSSGFFAGAVNCKCQE